MKLNKYVYAVVGSIVGVLLATQITTCNVKKKYSVELDTVKTELVEVEKDLALSKNVATAYKNLSTQRQASIDSLIEVQSELNTEKKYCDLTLRRLRQTLKECEANKPAPTSFGNSLTDNDSVTDYVLVDTVYAIPPEYKAAKEALEVEVTDLKKQVITPRIASLIVDGVNSYHVESYQDSSLLQYKTFTPISLSVKEKKKKGFLKFGKEYIPVISAPEGHIFELDDPYQLLFKDEQRLLLKSENVNEYLQRIMH